MKQMSGVFTFEVETAVLFKNSHVIERYTSTVIVDVEDAHILEGRKWHLTQGYCQSCLPNPEHPNNNRKPDYCCLLRRLPKQSRAYEI
jgi:hypothetical protein